ncbi:MAG: RidA family protein [Planctomycetota bacterium]
MKTTVSSGGPWESSAGYSRAVRVGEMVFVSGTTAADADGNAMHPGDAAEQARLVFDRIGRALVEAGSTIDDVVRTRMYVTDIARDGASVGGVHGEVFAAVRPAATMVEVAKLIAPGLLVEIEADAVVGAGSGQSPTRTM